MHRSIMIFEVRTFDELTTRELYQILQLRSEVFVVEQNCAYQDLDNKDFKALHYIGIKDNSIGAYIRIFRPGDYFKEAAIGRVIVKKELRGHGHGLHIMENSLKIVSDRYGSVPVRISAQKHLSNFYASLGFVGTGNEYLEDGIPHISMIRYQLPG